MSLSDKEKKYIKKVVSSGQDLDLEVVIEVINKKRETDDLIEIEEIMNFLEEITPNTKENKKASKHIKKGQELKYSKDIDAIVKKTTHITAGVLEELLPAIDQILKPPPPKKYTIIAGKTQAYLEQEVRKMMKLGWQPFGGVSAAAFGVSPVGGNQYIQAMVQY